MLCCAARSQRAPSAPRPPLRPAGEPDHVGVVEVDARVAQQSRRLVGVEAQLVVADLHHAPLRPQPRQRQRGLLPARHHELRSLRDVVQECGDRVKTREVGQELQVVEDQDDRFRHSGKRRADARGAARPDGPAGPGECLEHRRRDRLDPVQCDRDVAQQEHGVVIALVDGDRRERAIISLRQMGQERGLAEAGGATRLTTRTFDAQRSSMRPAFVTVSTRRAGGASFASMRSNGSSAVPIDRERVSRSRDQTCITRWR